MGKWCEACGAVMGDLDPDASLHWHLPIILMPPEDGPTDE